MDDSANDPVPERRTLITDSIEATMGMPSSHTSPTTRHTPLTSRRAFLATAASGAAISVAGCLGGGLSEAGQQPLAENPVGRDLDERPHVGPGHEKTRIALVEFTDPSCSFCASFHDGAFQEIQAEWVDPGEATVYNRFRPTVAEWGEQAMHGLFEVYDRQPSLYWDLKAGYFDRRDDLSTSALPAITEELLADADVDVDAVLAAIEEAAHEDRIENDASFAEEAGVNGVPTTLVFVEGAFSSALNDDDFGAFEAAVEEQ